MLWRLTCVATARATAPMRLINTPSCTSLARPVLALCGIPVPFLLLTPSSVMGFIHHLAPLMMSRMKLSPISSLC